jgi:Arm DNA-binding domain
MNTNGPACSLKELWAAALTDSGAPKCRDDDQQSPMHQNSAHSFQRAREPIRRDGSARYPGKISFGGNLCLLVRPQGGRYWHYHYRYGGKRKTLSLGTYPDFPTAQARHSAARRLLVIGIDPSLRRRELRRVESGALEADSAVPGKWLHTGRLVYGRFEIVTEGDLNPCFVNLTRAAEAAKRPAKKRL